MDERQDRLNQTPTPADFGRDAGRDESEPRSNRIRQRLDRTRADIDQTVGELQDRLAPSRLVREAVDSLFSSRTAGTASRRVAQVIRNNPVPAALVGVGLAWLIVDRVSATDEVDHRRAGRGYRGIRREVGGHDQSDWLAPGAEYTETYDGQESGQESDEPGTGRRLAEKAGELAQGAGEALRDAGQAVRGRVARIGRSVRRGAAQTGETIGNVGHGARDVTRRAADRVAGAGEYVREQAGEAAHYLGEQAHYASEQARHAADLARHRAERLAHEARLRAEQAREAAAQAYEREPLAVGAGVLALGLIAGLVIPSTRKEDELLGSKRDELLDQAKGVGREALQRGKHLASELAETVKEEASSRELPLVNESTPELVGKVAEVARTALHTVAGAVREEATKATGAIAGSISGGTSGAGQPGGGQGQSRGGTQSGGAMGREAQPHQQAGQSMAGPGANQRGSGQGLGTQGQGAQGQGNQGQGNPGQGNQGQGNQGTPGREARMSPKAVRPGEAGSPGAPAGNQDQGFMAEPPGGTA